MKRLIVVLSLLCFVVLLGCRSTGSRGWEGLPQKHNNPDWVRGGK